MEKEVFNTKNKFWIEIQSNLIFIGLVELLIYNVGLLIKYAIQRKYDFFTPLVGDKYGLYYNNNFWIIIVIIITLIFMYLTCKEALVVFTEGTWKRKLNSFSKGFGLGFLFTAVVSLMGILSRTIRLQWNGFDWRIVPLLVTFLIQCAAEEMLLRGYVPEVMKKRHSLDVICFVSGTLFIFHHILNMLIYGFNWIFCLNIFLFGVLFVLLMKWNGNFWITVGIHMAWNYAQGFIFGVGMSGNPSSVSIFEGIARGGIWFYDPVYGYEGALSTTILISAFIILLIYKSLKKEVMEG